MQNRNHVLVLVFLALVLASIAGCAAPAATPVPPTSAPPAATSVPPTATTAPTQAPTATVAPTQAPAATATTAAMATTAPTTATTTMTTTTSTGGTEMAKNYPKTPPSISAGAKVFAANCVVCHGDKGDGKGPAGTALNPPPADFADVKFARGISPQDWYGFVTNGVTGTAMAGWKSTLSDADIWNVVFYERAFSAPADQVAAGKALFTQNCVLCHGDQGNGKGPAGVALNPPPANFTDAQMMSAHTSQELFDTMTNGKGMMPAFKSTLTDDQRWSLVDYLWTFMTAP